MRRIIIASKFAFDFSPSTTAVCRLFLLQMAILFGRLMHSLVSVAIYWVEGGKGNDNGSGLKCFMGNDNGVWSGPGKGIHSSPHLL